jgi:hypothetical protein
MRVGGLFVMKANGELLMRTLHTFEAALPQTVHEREMHHAVFVQGQTAISSVSMPPAAARTVIRIVVPVWRSVKVEYAVGAYLIRRS